MGKVQVGKVDIQREIKKGWLVGQFMEEGPFKDDNIEVYYKIFPVGDNSDKLHFHPHGKDYMIVISGKAKFRIGEEILELKAGDYVAIPANNPDQVVEVIEEIALLGVRYPSIPNNKVFINPPKTS